MREVLELLLRVFAVIHGAPAGHGTVQCCLDVARRQIEEVQERLHLTVGALLLYSPDLRFWSKTVAMMNTGAHQPSVIAQALRGAQ